MIDPFLRRIHYLRISITDKCNLRCTYCLPEGTTFFPEETLLSYDEIIRISSVMADLGIDAIRLTGGEPLARKDCVELVGELKKMKNIKKVNLTTNGVFLPKYIEKLAEYKLDGLNISLDTLDQELFKTITGRDKFKEVIDGINLAIEHNIDVKINCVLVKGVNESEIIPIANLARDLPVAVRFIELMPVESCMQLEGIDSDEVLDILSEEYGFLESDSVQRGFGPAKYLKSAKLKGSIGFIDPMTHNFCAKCNKLRLTSDGFLKLCLYHDDGISLRDILRAGASDEVLKNEILNSVAKKPEKHNFNEKPNFETMSKIGG